MLSCKACWYSSIELIEGTGSYTALISHQSHEVDGGEKRTMVTVAAIGPLDQPYALELAIGLYY